MSLADIARKILPASVTASIARSRRSARRAKIQNLPVLTEKTFTDILIRQLGLSTRDTVYIGSSVDQLHLDFPFYRILALIQDVIGPKGNVLFPTYPNRSPMSSYEYLLKENIFDVRRTPSYTGLLSEFARRQRGALRSLHPTKSVCAIGPDAEDLTRDHQNSTYPHDSCSPFFKLTDYGAKVIGIGVWSDYISFLHCTEDALKEKFPVPVYHQRLFKAKCINYMGETELVETRAHNMDMVKPDVVSFVKEHILPEICSDLTINGMKFVRADARRLFDEMLRLARVGITPYPRNLYSKEFIKGLNPKH